MNFNTFPVGATNIFPLANSNAGGQLLTEFNLRSRESVATTASVQYMIGPSFTHSMEDYKLTAPLSTPSTLLITPGRALVNGHYVETLVPMEIDLNEANLDAKTQGLPVLKGQLCVGFRAMYSTLQTDAYRADTMKIEGDDGYYEGLQLVILPKDGAVGERFTLPEDSPTDVSKVNAHLKLGEISFINGSVRNIIQDESRCQYIEGSRIANISGLISDSYVKKAGLDPKKIYTFAGKGTDPSTGLDTWCDSTDSLMVWDANPNLITGQQPLGYPSQAQFEYDGLTGYTSLVVPHKQPDGMESTNGTPQYYQLRQIPLPVANYNRSTGGTVDKNFILSIKDIDARLNQVYNLPGGKMRKYVPQIDSQDDRLVKLVDETPISSDWNVGDYVLVGIDNSVVYSDTVVAYRSPSTLYPVIPGVVTNITLSSEAPTAGVLIRTASVNASNYPDPLTTEDGLEILAIGDGNIDRGEVGVGYFMINVIDTSSDPVITTTYYFTVSGSGPKEYAGIAEGTSPIILTGEVPLATEDAVGGFLNVPDTALGQGYVRRNDQGLLEILDWDILVSGVLAYQLGQDFEISSGYSIEEVQNQLDEYVNERVAFPNSTQIANSVLNGTDANVIHVSAHLNGDNGNDDQVIHVHDIDSRFGTSVYLHIDGTVGSNVQIIISGCEKIRVDLTELQGSPRIIIKDSCIYYDADILDKAHSISGLKLWYQREGDGPDLIVDGMTVQLVNRPERVGNEDYWAVETPNDNHYSYALRSLTFGSDGSVIGISMLVADDVTSNIELGSSAALFLFSLPQTFGLPYPPSRLNKQLKVTGQFTSAYPTTSPEGYIVKNTSFTALTQAYGSSNTTPDVYGTIAFYTNATHLPGISGAEPGQSIDCWETGKFNIFFGGTAE